MSRAKAGLHPTCARFLAERGVAALGSDGNNDTAPSTTAGIEFPIHALALNAIGLHLLDYLQLRGAGRRLRARPPLGVPARRRAPADSRRYRLAPEPDRDILDLDRRANHRRPRGADALLGRGRWNRGGVRPRRRHGRLLAAPPWRGAAWPARRAGVLHRRALDDGDPTASPVGESGRRQALPGRRTRARPRIGLAAAGARLQRSSDSRPALRGRRLVRGGPRRHRRRGRAARAVRLRPR